MRLAATAACFAAVLLSACAACASPAAEGYLVVAPKAAAPALQPLLDLRRKAYAVSVLTLESVKPDGAALSPADIKREIRRRRAAAPGLSYVLLVGDTRRVRGGFPALPTHPLGFDTWYGVLGTDNPRDPRPKLHVPVLSVGRFPAATAAELKAMVAKTIAYETRRRPGPWQRRLHAVAGAGNYSPAVDALIDSVGTLIFATMVPQTCTVTMTRGLTSSPYCYPPDAFEERVVALLDDGPLYFAYVGHGSPRSAMGVTGFARGKIMDCGTMNRVTGKGARRPVAFFVACDMGAFDRRTDCLAERALKAPGGPVACVASTRISHPYGNAVFGLELVRTLLAGGTATLGRRVTAARARTARPTGFDPMRLGMSRLSQVEGLGGMSARGQSAILIQHVYLYALFGDPALGVACPGKAVRPFRAAPAADGSAWDVTGTVAGMEKGQALVTLEVPRTVIRGTLKPIDPARPGWRADMKNNYATANRKVVAEARVPVADGRFRARLPATAGGRPLSAGTYHIKAVVWDRATTAVGVLTLQWEAPAAATPRTGGAPEEEP
jgi:hypothetical protein